MLQSLKDFPHKEINNNSGNREVIIGYTTQTIYMMNQADVNSAMLK